MTIAMSFLISFFSLLVNLDNRALAGGASCPAVIEIPAIEKAVGFEINEIPGNLQLTFADGSQFSYPIIDAPDCCVPGAYIIAEPILWRFGPGEPWQPTTKKETYLTADARR